MSTMRDDPSRRQRAATRLHTLTRNSLVVALVRATGTMRLNSSDRQTDQVEALVTSVSERDAIVYTSLYCIPALRRQAIRAQALEVLYYFAPPIHYVTHSPEELFTISTILAHRRQAIRVGLLEALYDRAPPSFYTTFSLEDASSDANEVD